MNGEFLLALHKALRAFGAGMSIFQTPLFALLASSPYDVAPHLRGQGFASCRVSHGCNRRESSHVGGQQDQGMR